MIRRLFYRRPVSVNALSILLEILRSMSFQWQARVAVGGVAVVVVVAEVDEADRRAHYSTQC